MPPVGPRQQQLDTYAAYEPLLAAASMVSPWTTQAQFVPNESLLGDLLTIPVKSGVPISSGRFPKALDVWVAHELRRAGFDKDAVWPRASRPRVMPPSLSRVLKKLPAADRNSLMVRLARMTNSGLPTEARVLGEFKSKQVDVVMAEWDRGAELMVTTKTMSSSQANNMANRYEEYIGEIRNLRGRFPLASIGLIWLVRSTIAPPQFAYLINIVRSLRDMDGPRGYDGGAVIVADWGPQKTVTLQQHQVPADLRLDVFMKTIVEVLLSRTPLDNHVPARHLHP